jgi:hypothetical protein
MVYPKISKIYQNLVFMYNFFEEEKLEYVIPEDFNFNFLGLVRDKRKKERLSLYFLEDS